MGNQTGGRMPGSWATDAYPFYVAREYNVNGVESKAEIKDSIGNAAVDFGYISLVPHTQRVETPVVSNAMMNGHNAQGEFPESEKDGETLEVMENVEVTHSGAIFSIVEPEKGEVITDKNWKTRVTLIKKTSRKPKLGNPGVFETKIEYIPVTKKEQGREYVETPQGEVLFNKGGEGGVGTSTGLRTKQCRNPATGAYYRAADCGVHEIVGWADTLAKWAFW